MPNDTTILIHTHNNAKTITTTLKKIEAFLKQHKGYQTTFLDQNSKDQTTKKILDHINKTQNKKITLLTIKKNKKKKELLNQLINKIITTNNVITLEPTLNHPLRNIPILQKKLKKNHIIIPDRTHPSTIIITKNKQHKKKLIRKIEQQSKKYKQIKDPQNTQIAIKTTTLNQYTQRGTNTWKKIIQKIDQEQKIHQPPTTYQITP